MGRRTMTKLHAVAAAGLMFLAGEAAADAPQPARVKVRPSPLVQTAFAEGRMDKVVPFLEGVQAEADKGNIPLDEVGASMDALLAGDVANLTTRRGLEDCARGHPDSYMVQTLLGMYEIRLAWAQRGAAYSNQTSDDQMRAFLDDMARAHDVLTAAARLNKSPYTALSRLVEVDMAQGNAMLYTDYAAAVRISPESMAARRRFLFALTPKWGGSLSQMRDYVAEVQKESIPDETKRRTASEELEYEADDCVRQTRLGEARKLYEAAFEAWPDGRNLGMLMRAVKLDAKLQDPRDAARLLSRALAVNPLDRNFLALRGYLYETQLDNLPGAVSDYQLAAQYGDVAAQARLGYLYYIGKGVEQDRPHGARLLWAASRSGNAFAKRTLAAIKADPGFRGSVTPDALPAAGLAPTGDDASASTDAPKP